MIPQIVADGHRTVRPVPGTGNPPNNRYLPSVDETHVGAAEVNNRATWTLAENVTELTITNAGAVAVRLVFDMTAANADIALADSGGAVEVMIYVIPPQSTAVFTGTGAFTSVDFERVSAETAPISIAGQ